jgi:hypothetical protein
MVKFNGVSLPKMAKGNTVEFVYCKANRAGEIELWYEIKVDDEMFSFPVPVSELGTATFLASDKATIFMRYMKKELEALESQRLVIEQARAEAGV